MASPMEVYDDEVWLRGPGLTVCREWLGLEKGTCGQQPVNADRLCAQHQQERAEWNVRMARHEHG